MNDYKRINTNTQSTGPEDPLRGELATIGMRIRKAVSDGYNRPVAHSSNAQSFQRQPLPAHMSQPPSLTNQYSTFESGSNLSEWEARNSMHTPQLQTLSTPVSNKRKMSETDEYVHPSYGTLQLNEDF